MPYKLNLISITWYLVKKKRKKSKRREIITRLNQNPTRGYKLITLQALVPVAVVARPSLT